MKTIEQIKRTLVLKRITFILINAFVLVGVLYLFWLNFILGYLLLIIWGFNVYRFYKKWIKFPFKKEIVSVCLKELRPNLSYRYEIKGKEILDLIHRYNLFSRDAYFRFTDYIEDTDEEVSYASVDLSVISTDIKSKKPRIFEFKGKVYILSVKKNSCDYIITNQGHKLEAEGFNKIDLESIEMNEKLDLYTNNSLEIFKVFTPKQIEACRKFQFFEDKKCIICHIGDSLTIFLSNGENQFEALKDMEGIKKEYFQQLENLKKYLEIF